MSVKNQDEICIGCPHSCSWFIDKDFEKLSPDQLTKMRICPCGVCIVKAMCEDDKQAICPFFHEHFKHD